MLGDTEKDAPVRCGGVVHDVGAREGIGRDPYKPSTGFLIVHEREALAIAVPYRLLRPGRRF